jgi:hypothetical protein
MALSGKTSATCGWLRGAGHPGAGRSPISGQFPEQIFPDSAPRPAHKSVADRRRWPQAGQSHPRQPLFNPCPMPPMTRRSSRLNPADIRRQARLKSAPLLIARPKHIPVHNFNSFPPNNHHLVASAERIMSSDPRLATASGFEAV